MSSISATGMWLASDAEARAFGHSEEHVFQRLVCRRARGARVGDRPVEERPTTVQDQEMAAHVLDQGQQVRADDDRCVLGGALAQGLLHRADAAWVEARERLVDEDRAWPV